MAEEHALLLVASLEVEVIAAEVAAGVNVRHAIRALYPHEVRATTRFGELDDETSAAVARVKRVVDDLWAVFGTWLATDLVDHADSGTALARRIRELRDDAATLPAEQRRHIERAATTIMQQLLAIRATWARLTRDEATRQGVPMHLLPDLRRLRPTPAEQDHLWLQAEHIASHPRRRILDVASGVVDGRNLAETDPAGLLDALNDKIAATPHDGSVDLGRQAVYSAGSGGRWQVAEDAPKPEYVYASELLDGRTCGPCAAMDGREWDSIDAAHEDYPAGGGYRGCEGGQRCRGTVVFVWDESEPTIREAPPIIPGGPDTFPEPATLPFTPADLAKTLDGAERGGLWHGGHAFDAANADRLLGQAKRCFPRNWSREQMERAVDQAVRQPQWRGAIAGALGDTRITHATVVDDVLVVASWQHGPNGYEFFSVYPENGFGVLMRNRKGAPGNIHGLDLSALDKYGIGR